MRPDQSLPELTARLLLRLDRVFADEAPDAVLAQGDTTTAMAVALAAFYRRIPVDHVVAGLRPGALPSPYPEEMKRIYPGGKEVGRVGTKRDSKCNARWSA